MGTIVVALILIYIAINTFRILFSGYLEKSWKKSENVRLQAKKLYPNDDMLMWIQGEIYPTPLDKVLTPAEMEKYKGYATNGNYLELKQIVVQRLKKAMPNNNS